MVEENFEIWLFGTPQKSLILLYYIVIPIISENQLNSKLIPNIPSGQPTTEEEHNGNGNNTTQHYRDLQALLRAHSH